MHIHIATLVAVTVALASGSAAASPRQSQHPRIGQLAELRFAPASDALAMTRPQVARTLGEIAAWARANPDGLVVLDGHADRRGGGPANTRLSVRRAKAVRAELIDAGVASEQIVIAAYGESDVAPRRRVVVWGTRAGMDAVIARSLRRGHAVIWDGVMTPADHDPQPGVVVRR